MEQASTSPVQFLNLEYFFRLLYGSRIGDGVDTFSFSSVGEWAIHFWSVLSTISFLFSLFALGLLAYATMRMYQIKTLEHHLYDTIEPEEAQDKRNHSRWAHIQSLIESAHERDWREAIMESDIMLEDILKDRGYEGETVAERLKKLDRGHFKSLEDAWEAHKMRNKIVHEGMQYQLDDNIAYRTIRKYEAIFKELGEL